MVLGAAADARAHDEQRAEAQQAGLERRHRGDGEAGVRAVAGRQREREQREPDERHAEAPPLPLADLEAEQSIGHDREQHEPARQHDLHDRQRRQRHRADVQDPGDQADEHPNRKPALTPERAGRAERMTDVDVARVAGTAMLVEERQVGGERAQQREKDSELKTHKGGQPRASVDEVHVRRAAPLPSTTLRASLTLIRYQQASDTDRFPRRRNILGTESLHMRDERRKAVTNRTRRASNGRPADAVARVGRSSGPFRSR